MRLQIIRRGILILLVISAAGVLAFGPRPTGKRPDNRVVIHYWEKWGGIEAEMMREIVREFNDSIGRDKGIYVEYLSISQVHHKTLVSTAAGVPPDIGGLWDTQLAQFAAMDALEPLEDLAEEFGIGPETYVPVYWRGCNYDGHLYALVSTPGSIALHYNKRVFRENSEKLRAEGLDPDRAPRTIEELDRYAKALTVYDPEDPRRILQAGYLPTEPGWYLAHTSFWFGTNVFDPKSGKFILTNPQNIRAYEWLQSYAIMLGKDSMTEFSSGLGEFSSPQNPFLAGKVVMEQQGPWMAKYISRFNPDMADDWAAAPFPSAVEGLENVSYCPFDVLMIPRGAKHKREAFEFIAYVNRQDVMERLCSMHCKNSPLRKVSDKFIADHPNPYIEVFQNLASSENARGTPQMPIWSEVLDELNVAAQRVYLMEGEPEQILRETQTRLQSKYDRYMERQKLREHSRQ